MDRKSIDEHTYQNRACPVMRQDFPAFSKDLLATYAAQAWIAVTGVLFVPVYLRHLGLEAYGLIGLFATFQAMMAILDFGMAPTLTRELARFKGGERDVLYVRDLLRSIEIAAGGIATAVVLAIWALSGWLVHGWLHSHETPNADLVRAIDIIGFVTVLRFVESLFRSALLGLQQQTAYNFIAAAAATLRAGGAAFIVAFISPTLDAFFVWQAVVSIMSASALIIVTYAAVPSAYRRGRFSLQILLSIWRFALGMFGISLLALALTQADKLLLSRLLSLAEYGRFMLATILASSIEFLVAPILQVFGPKFFRFHASRDYHGLVILYHEASQLITAAVGAPAVVIIVYADTILTAWTGDAALAETTAPIVRILAFGYLLNVLVRLPYQVQLAYNWLSLTLLTNVIAVLLIIPALLFIVPAYGSTGAAWVWAALNAGYILISVQLMHRRILRTEKRRWYWQDVIRPLAAASIVSISMRLITQTLPLTRASMLAVLLISFPLSITAAVGTAPIARRYFTALLLTLKRQNRV